MDKVVYEYTQNRVQVRNQIERRKKSVDEPLHSKANQ